MSIITDVFGPIPPGIRNVADLTPEEMDDPEIFQNAGFAVDLNDFDPDLERKYLSISEREAQQRAKSNLQQALESELYGLSPDEAAELERESWREIDKYLVLASERRDRQRAEARRLKRPPANVIPLRPTTRKSASRSRAPRTARRSAAASGGARDGPSGDEDGEPEPPGRQRAAGRHARSQYRGSMASVNGSSDSELRAAFEKIINLHARLLRCGDGHG